jgi:hypothetical protein
VGCHGLSTGITNLGGNPVRGGMVGTRAVRADTEVVDHHTDPVCGEQSSVFAPQAPASAGDDRHAAFEFVHAVLSSRRRRLAAP